MPSKTSVSQAMKTSSRHSKANQRIAVIGTGISGLTAAHLLSKHHEVHVFEANDYIGGHTHTVPVEMASKHYFVDTGFIVCNDRNYPHFMKLMDQLDVQLQASQMSFSVTNPALNLEYNGHNLSTLFAQKRNFLRPSFYRLIKDILRFNKDAKALLVSHQDNFDTLNEYLDNMDLGKLFRDNYLLPMVAAIWSCSVRQAGEFPLKLLLQFFDNHGLLSVSNRPQWFVLKGGSHAYIPALTKPFADTIRLNCPVLKISRDEDDGSSVQVTTKQGTEQFDHVIVACHSDQALALLAQPSSRENEILGAMKYQMNNVLLHTDRRLMPKRQRAWASWNFLAANPGDESLPCLTYSMNILQQLDSPQPILVSLNANHRVAEDKIIQRFQYAHPVFNKHSVEAQQRRAEICGLDNIHYCGAYWYNGFHEDGVRSALDVCARFGVTL